MRELDKIELTIVNGGSNGPVTSAYWLFKAPFTLLGECMQRASNEMYSWVN